MPKAQGFFEFLQILFILVFALAIFIIIFTKLNVLVYPPFFNFIIIGFLFFLLMKILGKELDFISGIVDLILKLHHASLA